MSAWERWLREIRAEGKSREPGFGGVRQQPPRNHGKDPSDVRRRNSDGRSWYEGSLEEAVLLGWVVSKQGFTLCPTCIDKGLAEMFKDNDLDASELLLHTNNSFATDLGN